jgi:putative DNA primase/helicase
MEFYQKSHFIAMTGDGAGYQRFESFDKPDMKTLIESKCDKRSAFSGVGKRVEGLSSMSDRDVVEKACKAKHGETFKALYNGQALQNNHSNSDMSLMNRLAFWCNGDKEQMLRIFATSGLFRPDKSPDYYEGTAIKAIKDTSGRFQPNTSGNSIAKKPPVNNSGSGFGKR